MALKTGLYEKIINQVMTKELSRLQEAKYHLEIEKIDEAEAHVTLSRYLQKVIQKALRGMPVKSRIHNQISLVNRIVELLEEITGDQSIPEAALPPETKLLLAILEGGRFATDKPSAASKMIRPVTRLVQSALFTGALEEPSLASELKKEILSADKIDILMSFIRWSGLRILADELETFTNRQDTRLRVITTTYIGATELAALDFLQNLPNTEIRVSMDNRRTRLHAKAYLFERNTGFSTAYIGSSNISNPALTSGLEWNLKVTAEDAQDILEKFSGTFETYWNNPDFELFSSTSRNRVKEALQAGADPMPATVIFGFDIRPYPFQEEILAKLEAERKVHGRYKNLVVAATGTGKTVVAAFDYKRFLKEHPDASLLFVAHREEILQQSLSCFRAILHDQNFGELFVGRHRPTNGKHLFLSVQTFHSREFWRHLPPDAYDYIIIDEFHHAEAPTYSKLLSHFTPRVMLGLTATPERMDGADVLRHFDNRIAAEIRLPEAIERDLLCSFQYFGIADSVNIENVTWTRGGYAISELENLYTGDDMRAKLIRDKLLKIIPDLNGTKGLGFCVSIRHAHYMAKTFNRFGIPSIALSSDSDSNTRNSAKSRLQKGEIKFIFVVDLYNEGVDIPEVDAVLFLRPTESLTVFLQQLGRGLRKHDGKECLTVLDFIGQAHRNYNFEQRFRALMGKTRSSVQKEIENNFPHLPSGCVITMEKVARDHVLENIRHALNRNRRDLVRKIASFTSETGRPLTLANFLKTYDLGLQDIYKRKGDTWSRLRADAGILNNFNDPDTKVLENAMRRLLHADSRRYIAFILNLLKIKININDAQFTEEQYRMLAMLYFDLWQQPLSQMGFASVQASMARPFENPHMLSELIEILQYNQEQIPFIDQQVSLPFACPLDLHCHYNRNEVLAATGEALPEHMPLFREGVRYIKKYKTDLLLVTLNKSEHDFSPSTMYEDYAISKTLFHWQSQSTTSEESPTGQRYINHRKTGNTILLFVRDNNKENNITMPFCYLGPVKYMRHQGSRPMSIVWELETPLPVHLWRQTGRLAVG